MRSPLARALLDRLYRWLDTSSIQQRLQYLTLLNTAGLVLLLTLSLLATSFKAGYFDAIERINTQQRELQHFNSRTARLQNTLQIYLHAPDENLQQQIDEDARLLLAELQTLESRSAELGENFVLLRESLTAFTSGYRELKQINQQVDAIYQQELSLPAQRAAAILAQQLENEAGSRPEAILTMNSFVDALLKMNAFYTKHEMSLSHATRSAFEHVIQTIPPLESKSISAESRQNLRELRRNLQGMISGLGKLQRAYTQRTQIMDSRIEIAQNHIAHTASRLDKQYDKIETSLRSRYAFAQTLINALAIVLGLLVVAISFGFGTLVFKSIRTPLRELLHTVEAFSAGDFEHPVPEIGRNELGQLAGSLREFHQSARQRTLTEHALRDSEGRFRALSDMSSDFFWEQNAMFQYTAFSGQRAGELLAGNVLMLGSCPWDNPRAAGYQAEWAAHRAHIQSHEPFRDFEFALQLNASETIYLLASGDPVFSDNGEFRGYRGTAKDISAQKASEAEIRVLNQTLEQRVIERTRELERSNEQLSHAMEQLVQSEKLASLGNLVAGVAHELNTPLGNALVAATSLRDQVVEVRQRVDQGTLRKSDLSNFIQLSAEGCELIERNAHRAVSLVANFKQVAVDQTSAQRRRFDLQQTVTEVVATLSPTLRKQQHIIDIDIAPGIILDSYPGPLDQVISNIVTNATVHAFRAGEPGNILISASSSNTNEVALMISDNGIGIDPDKHARVFDPFFTTRMGQGGSGLGLYIVYNIVTSLLGGSIQLLSSPGKGTSFLIRLPCIAPQGEADARDVHDSTPASPE
jgi:signal transduction histidine kinase/HAMP domain-containing protein